MSRTLIYLICLALAAGLMPEAQAKPGPGSSLPQPRLNAVGIRLGTTSGFSYWRLLPQDRSVEMLLSFRRSGVQISGVYAWQKSFLPDRVAGFWWYYGVGGHFGYYRYYSANSYYYPPYPGHPPGWERNDYYRGTTLAMGADGQLGMAWRPDQIPLQVAFEMKPYVDILDWYDPVSFHIDFGLVARFAF